MSSSDSGKEATNSDILEELKKIETLLTPAKPPQPKGFTQEFTAFLNKYGVVGFMVAFVFAIYLGDLIQQLVSDFVMPLLGLALGQGKAGEVQNAVFWIFLVGPFSIALITFLVVAVIIFVIVKLAGKYLKVQ